MAATGRPPEVSVEKIREAAEALLTEMEGDLDRVTGRKVFEQVGGGNQRVNRVVREWRAEKSQKPRLQEVEKVSSPVPDLVTQALEEATAKLLDLGPLVAKLIDSAVQAERRRSEMAIAAEREAAKTAVEELERKLQEAADEADEYAGDLDDAQQRNEELAAHAEALRASLEEMRAGKVGLQTEIGRLEKNLSDAATLTAQTDAKLSEEKKRRERAEHSRDEMETRISALSAAHADTLKAERAARREELKELRDLFENRADRAEKAAEKSAEELRKAQETIEALKQRLEGAPPAPDSGNTSKPKPKASGET